LKRGPASVKMRRVHRRIAACVVGLALAGSACGVRTPSRIDVAALLHKHGALEARRTLAARVIEEPRDVQARLALAELAEQLGRPAEAIEQLEAVQRLGGPIGIRWHDADRARLARLLAARGQVRLARGAASALDDLRRAQKLGASLPAGELPDAELVHAIARLRHVDAGERAHGRAELLAIASGKPAIVALQVLARPAASPADRAALGVWLWSVGARRAAFEELDAWHAATPARDAQLEAAYLRALAWWSPVWLGQGHPPPADELAAAGAEKCLFPEGGCAPPSPRIAPSTPPPVGDGYVAAAVAYAASRAGTAPEQRLRDVALAFLRDPAIAERIARDVVAEAADSAAAYAAIGALFDALGDPQRARLAWQAAVDSSPEPAFYRGLAEAAARGGDGSAALVFATTGAAASGDPAVTWLAVARALDGATRPVDALVAARSAIDLAGPEVLPGALDVAISASRALGRDEQVGELAFLRARFPAPAVNPAVAAVREHPSADAIAGLWVAAHADPFDIDARRLLLDVLDADDPRRAALAAQLVGLARSSDDADALAAVFALRGQ
jgi:tetratricopeptide (TPR) repeat protein